MPASGLSSPPFPIRDQLLGLRGSMPEGWEVKPRVSSLQVRANSAGGIKGRLIGYPTAPRDPISDVDSSGISNEAWEFVAYRKRRAGKPACTDWPIPLTFRDANYAASFPTGNSTGMAGQIPCWMAKLAQERSKNAPPATSSIQILAAALVRSQKVSGIRQDCLPRVTFPAERTLRACSSCRPSGNRRGPFA